MGVATAFNEAGFPQGQLVTNAGYTVQPGITIPTAAQSVMTTAETTASGGSQA